jgi:alkylation response protein AidB-like acyl-CoA dehydrogenase
VMFNYSLRIVSIQARDMVPNYEASMSKLFGSELGQRVANTGVKVFGLYSGIWSGDRAPLRSTFTHSYVNSISSTIAAGSSEIQRGIIATRGLGLPRG